MPEEVSGFRTYVPGDRSLMSRDIGRTLTRGKRSSRRREGEGEGRSGDRRCVPVRGWADSRGHVPCSRRCPSSRFQAAVGHRRCCRVRVLPPASTAFLARYREGGLDALEPRSRRPKSTPIATPEDVRRRVIGLRSQLSADGLDAGPVTIGWHLEREGLRAPSTSTIRRILRQAGLITPEPRKRPRSS